jgi:hypothetical protein
MSPYAGSHISREIVEQEEKNRSNPNNSVESKISDTLGSSLPTSASLKRNQRLPGFVSLPSRSPHTGVSIGGENFQPSVDTPPFVTEFIEKTLQNATYDSPEHLQLRAENFFRYIEAERAINLEAGNAMRQPDSPVARQSAHLTHLVRGIWSKAELDPEIREQLHKEILDRKNISADQIVKKSIRIFKTGLNAMFARAEEGPLTLEQSQFGVEVSFVLGRIAKELKSHSNLLSMLDKYSSSVAFYADRAGTHHLKDAHGVNLSSDLGSKIRDELGLPVMLGTSGSGSDTAATAKFASNHQGVPLWADGLTEDQGKRALIDAVFHHLREQIAPIAVKPAYDAMRVRNGAETKTVDPFMMFIHSYPEVSSGVEMTLNEENGKDEPAMRRSSKRVQERLNLFRNAKIKMGESSAQE